jgi:magnesium-transporting ATPase (P-type)
MALVGVLGATIVYELFTYYRNNGASIEYARTVAVNALVLVELFYLFTCRFLNQTIFSRLFLVGSLPMLIASVSVIGLQVVFSYLPQSQQLFGLVSISGVDWLIIVFCTFPVMLIVEAEKFVQRKLKTYSGNVAQSAI